VPNVRLRDRLTRPLRAVRRAVLIRRRLLAAVLTAVAVATGVHAAAAPPPPTVGVLTAARDLPAGTLLAESDLVEREFATDSVPDGVADEVVGRRLAAPVRGGEPVTDVRLVGAALAASDPSLIAVPVRFPDAAMVDLLHVGDVIDVLATDPQGGGATVVASGVPVLAIPPADDESGGDGQTGALVVLGAPDASVIALADAGTRLFLTFAYSR
jgi:Flp pilus assembly protein CpaB